MAKILPTDLPQDEVSELLPSDVFVVQKASEDFCRPLLGSLLLGLFRPEAYVGTMDGYLKVKVKRVAGTEVWLGGPPPEYGDIELYFQWAILETTTGSETEEWNFPVSFPNEALGVWISKGYYIFPGESAIGASVKDRHAYYTCNTNPPQEGKQEAYMFAVGY